jgi:hypothetical protein
MVGGFIPEFPALASGFQPNMLPLPATASAAVRANNDLPTPVAAYSKQLSCSRSQGLNKHCRSGIVRLSSSPSVGINRPDGICPTIVGVVVVGFSALTSASFAVLLLRFVVFVTRFMMMALPWVVVSGVG